MRKLNVLLYKFIGLILIVGLLSIVHFSYFTTLKYGHSPFFMLCLVYGGVYLILPYILDKIILSVSLAFYAIYTVVQVCYCKLFDQYLFLSTAFNLFEEAAAYTSDALDLVSSKEILILIVSAVLIVLLCLLRRKKSKRIQYSLICIVLGALALVSSFAMGLQREQMIVDLGNDVFVYNQTDRYLYDKISSKKTFVEYFGLESFLYRDLKDHYFVNGSKTEEEIKIINEFLSENLSYEENEYTGMLEGKHLLLIEAESLTMAAIDETLTPTLHKLLNEGWFFDNFYSPTMTGSTSDVETMVNTSLIAINTGEIASQSYAENTYPTTLAKGFANKGYVVNAFHNNYSIYYNRENYFKALGYEKFLDSAGLGLENGSSDLIVGSVVSWIPVFSDLDFSFWVTYSGHQPYDMDTLSDTAQYPLSVQQEYQEYISLVQSVYPDLDEAVQLYLAKNISLDKAVESYIKTYEWMGKLDQLVIAFYGDHYVKLYEPGVKKAAAEYLGRSMDDTPFVIWYPGIEPQVIDTYCTDIDIMPTLFNLYHVQYDKTTILGNDIFDARYKGFYFDTAWNISSNSFDYDAKTREFTRLEISEEEASAILNRYMEYQEISNLIFMNDYFKRKESE